MNDNVVPTSATMYSDQQTRNPGPSPSRDWWTQGSALSSPHNAKEKKTFRLGLTTLSDDPVREANLDLETPSPSAGGGGRDSAPSGIVAGGTQDSSGPHLDAEPIQPEELPPPYDSMHQRGNQRS